MTYHFPGESQCLEPRGVGARTGSLATLTCAAYFAQTPTPAKTRRYVTP